MCLNHGIIESFLYDGQTLHSTETLSTNGSEKCELAFLDVIKLSQALRQAIGPYHERPHTAFSMHPIATPACMPPGIIESAAASSGYLASNC